MVSVYTLCKCTRKVNGRLLWILHLRKLLALPGQLGHFIPRLLYKIAVQTIRMSINSYFVNYNAMVPPCKKEQA